MFCQKISWRCQLKMALVLHDDAGTDLHTLVNNNMLMQ